MLILAVVLKYFPDPGDPGTDIRKRKQFQKRIASPATSFPKRIISGKFVAFWKKKIPILRLMILEFTGNLKIAPPGPATPLTTFRSRTKNGDSLINQGCL